VTKGYLYKVLLYLDIFVCALVFRDADCTISAETGLALKRPQPPLWAKVLGAVLNFIRPGHTAAAIEDDIARAQAAISYLQQR
jgi:hypothetical protein